MGNTLVNKILGVNRLDFSCPSSINIPDVNEFIKSVQGIWFEVGTTKNLKNPNCQGKVWMFHGSESSSKSRLKTTTFCLNANEKPIFVDGIVEIIDPKDARLIFTFPKFDGIIYTVFRRYGDRFCISEYDEKHMFLISDDGDKRMLLVRDPKESYPELLSLLDATNVSLYGSLLKVDWKTMKQVDERKAIYRSSLIKNPEIPTKIVPGWNPKIALFCAQMILNFELGLKKLETLQFPEQLIHEGFLKYSTAGQQIPELVWILRDPETKTVYLLIRGTHGKREWLQNLKYSQIMAAELQPILQKLQCEKGTKVHKGFLQIIISLRKQLETKIEVLTKSNAIDNIVITGHSLGGGLTPILAVLLAEFVDSSKLHGYTFGSPRVGNSLFAKCIDGTFPNRFFRVANAQDPITKLPEKITGAVGNSDKYCFEHAGIEIPFDFDYGSIYANHTLPVYIDFCISQLNKI